MTALAETIEKRVGKRKDQAEVRFVDIVRAEAAGKAGKARAEELEQVLLATGKSLDDFSAAVDLAKQANVLRAEAGKIDQARKNELAAAHKRQAIKAESERVARDYHAQLVAVGREQQNLNAAVRRAEEAGYKLAELQWEHSETLGFARPDLNTVTPTCRNEMPSHYDPAAPKIKVSRDVFQAEQRRRRDLYDEAFTKAQTAHTDACQTFQARYGQDGRRGVKVPAPPEFKRPEWADIVKRIKS